LRIFLIVQVSGEPQYLGEYQDDTIIDISNLKATSIEQFICVNCSNSSRVQIAWSNIGGAVWYQNITYTEPTLAFENDYNELKLTVGSIYAQCASTQGGNFKNTQKNKVKLYYLG